MRVQIPLLKVQQPIGVFYLSVMPAETILKITDIKRKKSGQGIQREASQKRIKEISEYCSDVDAAFPTPIIIAVYDAQDISITEDCLQFNDKDKIGEVIDGQHRLLGIERSRLAASFHLPVVLLFNLTEEEKAYIFSIINSTQTKVSMSLIYDLFDVAERRSPQKTCHEIARLFNSDEQSPFYNRLKMLGTKEGELSSLSQGTFIKYLLPLISRNPDEDARLLKVNQKPKLNLKLPFQQYFIDSQDEKIYKILFNMFIALRQIFPNEWDDHKNYILSKTTGYGAVMKAFPTLYTIGKENKRLNISFFTECFDKFNQDLISRKLELTSEYFGSNEQAINKLKQIIIDSQNK